MSGMSLDTSAPASGLTAEQIIFIAQNPDALTATLKTINDAKAAADASIALVGPADQIADMRVQAAAALKDAETKRNAAQGLVDAANNQAASIIAQATADAKALTDKASSDAAVVTRAANDLAAANNDKAVKLTDRETAVKARENTIGLREADAEKAIAAANATREAFEQRQAALSAALKGVA